MKDRISNIIVNLFIIVTTIILISILYSKFIKKDRITSIFGKSILVVRTGSMEPTINPGDMIVISKEYEYKKGDIVTFYEDGTFVTHRIVKINEDGYTTKGDANDLEDGKIGYKDIQGRMIFRSHIFGFIILYLLKPFVLLYFILIIFIYIFNFIFDNKILQEDISFNDKQNKKKEETNE